MRLIDADELIKVFLENDEYGIMAIYDVNQLPTAYDVDKVVEQLEEASDLMEYDLDATSYVWLESAIEIVKEGGK